MLPKEFIEKAKAVSTFVPPLSEIEASYLAAAGHFTYPGERKDMFDRAMAEHEKAVIRKIMAHIDRTPAILWVGKGGIKERLTALVEGTGNV